MTVIADVRDLEHRVFAGHEWSAGEVADTLHDLASLLDEVAALITTYRADHYGRTECFEAMVPHLTEIETRLT